MRVQFVHPLALHLLWLLPVIWAAWLIVYRRGEQKLDGLFAPRMRRKLCPSPAPMRFYWQSALLVAGLMLAVVAAARPQWGAREQKISRRGRDLVIALDVSRSMLARDVRPNRLQRAMADIVDLLRELRGDRVALIVFRNSAVQICPLTIDRSFLELALSEVTIDSAPPGRTDIGAGIIKALESFEPGDDAHRAVILISDGEDLSGRITAAAEQARDRRIPIFTIGLGSPGGATVPDDDGNPMLYQGEEVISRLEPAALKKIAEVTGGAYVPAGTANVDLAALYRDHLGRIAARDIEEAVRERLVDRYQLFLVPAFFLFLATAFLSRGRPATGRRQSPSTPIHGQGAPPRFRNMIGAIALFCIAGTSAFGKDAEPIPETGKGIETIPLYSGDVEPVRPFAGREVAHAAQQLHQQGEYQRAAELFMASSEAAPSRLGNKLLFNAGCALYRAGEYEAAAGIFQDLAGRDHAGKASASYNLGCSLYQHAVSDPDPSLTSAEQLALLEQSGLAFQNALRLDPGDIAAAGNLSVVTNILPGAREQVKIEELLAQYGGSQPFEITDKMLENQRGIQEELEQAATNTTPARIQLLENLGARQQENADLLIPLQFVLESALKSDPAFSGQPHQFDMLNRHIGSLLDVMHQAARELRDLDNNARNTAATSESAVYDLWKATAPYAAVLREDIRRQANAISMTGASLERADESSLEKIRTEQEEAADLTDLFINRFSEAAEIEGRRPGNPAEAGSHLLADETRAAILDLAGQAAAAQKRAAALLQDGLPAESLSLQEESGNLLEEIRKLLPKDPQQPREHPTEEQDEREHEPADPKGPRDMDHDPSGQDEHPAEPGTEPETEPIREEDAEAPEPPADRMSVEEARMLLQRAEQREREHKREKMLRSYTPPSQDDMDW